MMQVNKFKPIIAGIILILFILFNHSISVNLHHHFLENGYLLVHAHPINKNHSNNFPLQPHQHSNLEFLIFSLFTIIEFIIIVLGIIILVEKQIILSRIVYSLIPVKSFYTLPVHRGPPSH